VSLLRIMVADDELQARKRLTRLCEAMPDVEVVAVCASAEEVLALLPGARPDLLLLDISMPGLSGLEACALLTDGARAPTVVFVTAHAEHAIEAFELGAVDYVLKPVTAARLAKAIVRARERHDVAAGAALSRIAIETRKGIILLDPVAIICARFDGALVTILTAKDAWVSTASLTELEGLLPRTFVRVDRRHLLNLAEIVRLERRPAGGYDAITRTGLSVPVSRQVGRDLCKRLGL
jgi:two-component system, LytTR family, response regulator